MLSVSYVTCIDIIAQVSLTQWSAFLFLDVSTLKLIIILPTDRPTGNNSPFNYPYNKKLNCLHLIMIYKSYIKVLWKCCMLHVDIFSNTLIWCFVYFPNVTWWLFPKLVMLEQWKKYENVLGKCKCSDQMFL